MEDHKRILSVASRVSALTCAAWLASSIGAATAQAPTSKPDLSQTALEQYRDMSADERAELASEAAAISASPHRKATAAERAMIVETPAQARVAVKENFAKRSGGQTGKEFRVGDAVGKVVGSAFLTSRKVTITADGKHLESCGTLAHEHDAKTSAAIAQMAKSDLNKKGGMKHE